MTADMEREIRATHVQAWAYDGNLDYCPVCLDAEGANWPCTTIRNLDTEKNASED